MRRLILLCLTALPLLVSAENSKVAPATIPEPPELTQKALSGKALSPDAADKPIKNAPLEAVPEQPDIPLPVQSGENLQPDITITRGNKKTIQEYSVNGVVYMIKVIPDKGPPYYLIDTNGDGKLDIRGSDLDKGLNINMWKLLEWD